MDLKKQIEYNRLQAVKYAKTYALSPNPNFKYFNVYETLGGDCTNFISQCLLAGGATMTYIGEHAWWYNKSNSLSTVDDKWSISWAVAHSLYWTLKVNYETKGKGVKGQEVSNVSVLELGDVIFYENPKGIIYHSAIVTGFSPSYPLISQHTYEACNIPYMKPLPGVKYHYIKII